MSVTVMPSTEERSTRDKVMNRVLSAVKEDKIIMLPNASLKDFEPDNENFALLSVGIEPNDFGGTIGDYRYQIEGEDDLLHLIIVKTDQSELTAEEAQAVATHVFQSVPPALMWFKPGKKSHHFYLGHDVLLEYLEYPSAT